MLNCRTASALEPSHSLLRELWKNHARHFRIIFIFLYLFMFLDSYIDEINRLCENHKVRQLFAFGSVLNSKFTNDSDVDFVVDFNTSDPIEYAENYFALKFALEELLNRPIDLMEQKAIRNKYLALSINNSKKIIYEA